MEITDELKILVTAEVDKAVKGLTSVDSQTKKTTDTFKLLGKTISSAFIIKGIADFGKASGEAWKQQEEALNILNNTIQVTGAADNGLNNKSFIAIITFLLQYIVSDLINQFYYL